MFLYRLASHIPLSDAAVFLCSEFRCNPAEVGKELALIGQELNVCDVFCKWREMAGTNATTEELERLLNESENDGYRNRGIIRTVRQTLKSI